MNCRNVRFCFVVYPRTPREGRPGGRAVQVLRVARVLGLHPACRAMGVRSFLKIVFALCPWSEGVGTHLRDLRTG